MATRQFIELVKGSQGLKSIRIMQWNLLARGLCSSESLPMSNQDHLDFEKSRLPLMYRQVGQLNPDLISAEELDQKDELMDVIGKSGYECIFVENPDSPCLSLKPPSPFGPDGVAVIFKPSKLTLVKHEIIRLPIAASELDPASRFKVAIFAQFKLKNANFLFNFVCLHLKAKKGCHDIRAFEFKKLHEYLEHKENLPTVLSGDFNAEPSEQVIADIQAKNFYSAIPTDSGFFSTAKIQSNFKDRTLSPTRHVRLIDYIFYRNVDQPGNVLPVCYLAAPDNVDSLGMALLPNADHPSDHLPLVVDFAINLPNENT